MKVHEIDVAVNLRATLPSIPEPPKSEEPLPATCDGTKECHASYTQQSVGIPNPFSMVGDVQCWWAGPWPVFHSRIDKTTPEGFTFKYQAARDLLCNTWIEEASLVSNDPNNPIQGSAYLQALVDTLVAE